MSELKLSAEWKNDCQGKMDFDCPIIELSTRYWPRGGGFSTFNSQTGKWDDNPSQQPPSAKASICIRTDGDLFDVAWKEFEAQTQEEVQRAVEQWANEQFARVAKAVRAEFAGDQQ